MRRKSYPEEDNQSMLERQNLLIQGQKLKKAYDGAFHAIMAQYGLTRNEIDVLLFLANNPGCETAAELVELRGLAKSQVCKSVDDLTARGLLHGESDPADRRRVRLTPLPAAAPAAAAAQAAQQDFCRALYRGVTAEERAVLSSVFAKIDENLRDFF